MIRFKVDLLNALKKAGYTSYKLRVDKIFGQASMQKMREKKLISWADLDKSCELLKCQPGDLLEWVPGEEQKEVKNEMSNDQA